MLSESQKELILDTMFIVDKWMKCNYRYGGKDDIRAEAYLALCKSAEKFSGTNNQFAGYAYNSISNHMTDLYRKKSLEVETVPYDEETEIADNNFFEKNFELLDNISSITRTYSNVRKKIIVLFMHGFKRTEISEMLLISYKVVVRTINKFKKDAEVMLNEQEKIQKHKAY